MNNKEKYKLTGRFAGAAIGAAIFASPALHVNNIIDDVYAAHCSTEALLILKETDLTTDEIAMECASGYEMFSSDVQDYAAMNALAEGGAGILALIGGLYGWRRGRNIAGGIYNAQQEDTPGVKAPDLPKPK